jgi:site-specific DNA-cytosine methylase
MLQKINWFCKSKRASNADDNETWQQGGVVPTLNAFDMGDTRATVLILFEPKSAFEENWGESKVKNALRANASKSSHIIFYGNRVDDIRIQNDVINTLQARMGTGGGNMPIVAYSIREDAQANNFSATETGTALTLQSHQPSTQSHHAQLFIVDNPIAFDTYNQTINEKTTQTICSLASDVDHVGAIMSEQTVRRLTPIECERLQGFPDGWTEGQADSNRYKQMGNAVAVPVVSWIIERLVTNA